MDTNTEMIWRFKLTKLCEKIRLNQMDAYIADSRSEAENIIEGLIPRGCSVCYGGSMTLVETGILDALRTRDDIIFYDRAGTNKHAESDNVKDVYRQAFLSDFYLTSTNAITEDGWLMNTDANGNRVAAMLFGPQNVIVVCGRNKLVRTEEEARRRIRDQAAPANCLRLGRKTPCAATGYCSDCASQDRICNVYTLIKRQADKGRIKVIMLNYDAGY